MNIKKIFILSFTILISLAFGESQASSESQVLLNFNADKSSRNVPAGVRASGLTIINLWSVNCGPCRHEMPQLVKIAREYGVGLIFLSQDKAKNRNKVGNFLKRRGIPAHYNQYDPGNMFGRSSTSLPYTYIAKGGKVLYEISGARSWKSSNANTKAFMDLLKRK